jgi:transglutaminase-like putative cysteine protease
MTRARGSLASNVALAAVSATTALVAMYAWRGFAERPGGFLNPLLLLAIVVAGTGTTTRWWRWPVPAVVLTQVVVSATVASLLITGSPVPVGGAFGELRSALDAALDTSQKFAAPVPVEAPPIDPMLVLCGLLCLLMVDLLACTLRRVPLAGLPLLTIYSIPVSMVDSSIAWWVFALTAAGFLTMLFLQESDQVSRWGRPLVEDRETGDPISFGAGKHAVRGTASGIGGIATALAIVVPLLIPTVGLHVFDFGPGNGDGDDIRVDNPTADLVRDLKRGDDTPLIRITTTDPDPSYLRILTLTRFSDAEWSPGDRDVPVDQDADGLLPPPAGVAANLRRTEQPYDVTILPQFDSTWLPTQYPVSAVRADGDWRYDDQTMDFLAVPDDLTTAGLHYSMDAVDLDLTAELLEKAGASRGRVSEAFTDLPTDLPEMVRQLAIDVTQEETTPYEKAVALQNWFREDGGFTYSLDTEEGNGSDALVAFLTEGPDGRTGYCEQFASAMAVMARALGIPARVAIGFLNPSPDGPSSWVYSSDDMHAWPELYFDGAGWVRFEPTPAGRAEDVPSYTVADLGGPVEPEQSQNEQGSSAPIGPSNRPTLDQQEAGSSSESDAAGGGSWTPVAGGAGAVLVAGILLTPRVLRRRRRAQRLSAGGPEEVWDELRDTAVDLGVPWPTGRSPRATRNGLVEYLGIPLSSTTPDRPTHGATVSPDGVAALDRILLAVERLRYARPASEAYRAALRADGETVVSCLAGGATRTSRRRADWWPHSVLGFTARRKRSAGGSVESRLGAVVDHAN